MKSSTQYSILMSLYAKEKPKFLYQCLNSIFNQSVEPDEVIIVEDGPLTKELYEILNDYEREHPELHRVKLPENVGLGRALNEGLKHCSYELIARMDTDDIAKPDRFEKQVKFMLNHPEVDICSGWVEEFEGDISNVRSIKKVPETHEEISKYICNRNPLNHPAVMFRKQSVEKVGGYKHFPLFEDWYLWARMFVNGARFANIPDTILHFRTSPDMYKRRGGMKYAMDNARFQWTLHLLGLKTTLSAINASILRSIVYLMPNKFRAIIYSKFLRS